jgi:predicted PurR-regulated permease PerM
MSPADLDGDGPNEAYHRAIILLLTMIAVPTGVALLYYGQDLLAPLAIAALLYVLITALLERVNRLAFRGHSVPRWLTYLIVLSLLGTVAIFLANVIAGQVEALTSAAPRYIERFKQLSDQLGDFLGPELMESFSNAVAQADFGQALSRIVNRTGATFGATSLVLLFLAFMLVDAGALQRKLPVLVPDNERRSEVAAALDAMKTGVQNYMWIKTLVSLLTSGLSYVVMKAVGLDFAETWAILIFLLNFIPTIGSIIGAVLPATAGLVQFPEFGPVLVLLVGLGAIQFVVGNMLEPTLSSRTLNLSPLAIILALSFWSAVWGIPGAFLSVPLTVCFAIMCSQVPALRMLAVLLASKVPGQAGPAENQHADTG